MEDVKIQGRIFLHHFLKPDEQGLEGYFRDSGIDQNTVRESGKR